MLSHTKGRNRKVAPLFLCRARILFDFSRNSAKLIRYMHLPRFASRRAFSLVEMSIVLVIIALIVGGIMEGRSLLRASEVRTVITDANAYKGAITQFKTQYRYLPGDMPNAQQYWPTTVNGNGNGIVEYTSFGTGSTASVAGGPNEAFLFWQHLALAGMVQGNYNGLADPASTVGYTIGVNSPLAQVDGVVWGASYVDCRGGCGNIFNRDYRDWLTVGSLLDVVYADSPFLTTSEAYSIDTKMDDGLPGAGIVQMTYDNYGMFGTAAEGCSNAASGADFGASYKLSNTAKNQCGLLFKYP